ncbi:retrotransposon protein, putative, ty1-copia subclass [Tanacetum coccineum]
MDGNIHTYKARLVAKGFTQTYRVDYEETFSPVADIKAIRILIAIAAYYDYEIWQMDVKTAFLNGRLNKDVYMVQPEGFVNPKHPRRVCKLQRSIYGLKQASRSWNKRFDEEIKKYGFTQNPDEPCVYKRASGSIIVFLILYVDDILLMGNNIPMLQDVKSWLGKCFAMKDLGEAAYILGIKIYRDRSRRLIGLSQNAYIDKILKRFKMDTSKRGTILMQPNVDLRKSQGPSTPAEVKRMKGVPYASAVGSIMYAVRCTRPDVAFSQNLTSRYQQNPGESHWTAVKNILKYLRNTKDMFLVYGGDSTTELGVTCYTDASTTAMSSMEAEYIAAAEATMEAIWIRKFIYGLGVVPSIDKPMDMYCDNTDAITIADEHGVQKGQLVEFLPSGNKDKQICGGTATLKKTKRNLLKRNNMKTSLRSKLIDAMIRTFYRLQNLTMEREIRLEDILLLDGTHGGENHQKSVPLKLYRLTAKEKTNKKNDVKARSLLLMALPNEHQLTFSSRRFLPHEWNTHVVVWMNKAEIKIMSIDDLHNNFKIVEQSVKKSISASSGAQNLAFMTIPSTSSTNDVNIAKPAYEVSTVSPNVNTASPQVSTASFSDNNVYAFMVKNPNGYNLLQQDLEQIHEDDLEAIDLKWQLSLLSMREKRYFQRTGKKIFINANDTARYDKSKVECFNCHKMGHFDRECRAPRNKEGQFKYQDNTRKQGNNKDTSSKAMLAIDVVGCLTRGDMAEEQVSDKHAYGVATLRWSRHFMGCIKHQEHGLQVQQKEDGIFISQDKYVDMILKKFNYTDVESASTLVDLEKPLVKDEDANDVDVHLYRSMIGSLMYLTTCRPDIMFAICACARFQVTLKTSHLLAVKKNFRYLKGKPTLGLWYSRDSPFELVPYTDSDYARATQDRKSTIRGCQFLGNRLISWHCKKQTVVSTSTTEAEYVAAASCCGQCQASQKEVGTQRYLSLVVPLKKDGDEAVHKELGDRMERAATTASRLEAEQESVDKKKVIIMESSIRSDLHLEDAGGNDYLPSAIIFEELTRMGYEKPSQRLTLYKAFFSPQ